MVANNIIESYTEKVVEKEFQYNHQTCAGDFDEEWWTNPTIPSNTLFSFGSCRFFYERYYTATTQREC
jgi:hypothetical protein